MLIFKSQMESSISPLAFFLGPLGLGLKILHPFFRLLYLGLLLCQLACEPLYLREARDALDFQVSRAREEGKICKEVISIADHQAWPFARPLSDLRFVGLAEDLVLSIQCRDGNDDPVAVGLVVLVHAQVLVAPHGQGAQVSLQDDLRGRVWANLEYYHLAVGVSVRVPCAGHPVRSISDLQMLSKGVKDSLTLSK